MASVHVSVALQEPSKLPSLREHFFSNNISNISPLKLGSHGKTGCCTSGKSWKSATVCSSEKRKSSKKTRSRGTETNKTVLKYFRMFIL